MAVAAYLFSAKPAAFLEKREGVVVRSELAPATYHRAGTVHALYAQLDNGQIVRVSTLVHREIPMGKRITLRHYKTWYGYSDYRWEPL